MHIFCYVVYIWHRLPFCQDFITAHSSLTHCGIHSFNKYSPCPLATLNIEKFTGRRRNWVGSALAYINSQVKATLTADISSQIDTKKERHCILLKQHRVCISQWKRHLSGGRSIIEGEGFKTLNWKTTVAWWHCLLFNSPRIRETFENLFGSDAPQWWKHNWRRRRNKTDFLESWRGALHCKAWKW